MQAPIEARRSYCLTLSRPFQKPRHLDKVFIISMLAVCVINTLALTGYLSPLELGLSNIGIMCIMGYVTFCVFAITQSLPSQSQGKVEPIFQNVFKCILISLLAISAIVATNGAGCADLLSIELMASLTLGLSAFNLGAQAWYVRERKQMFRADHQ